MSSFTTPLVVRPLDNGRDWLLEKEFEYWIGAKANAETIKVPINFKTDFASIPRALWFMMPPWGRYGKAAVIHDYLYRKGKIMVGNDGNSKMPTRREADRIFNEAMKVLGVKRWKRYILYFGVRLGGWKKWNRIR